jgi:hypothetical protein
MMEYENSPNLSKGDECERPWNLEHDGKKMG